MAGNWLAGRTVLAVASEDRVPAVVAFLRERGATAIPFPTIRIVPPTDLGPVDDAIRRWRSFDWVVFTSSKGVEAVVSRAKVLRVDLAVHPVPVAVVGPATRAAAEAAGLPVRAMPDTFLTDAIAGALGDVCGRTILLPRSALARTALAEELRARGANVREVDAYDAAPATPDPDRLRSAASIDYVLVTSASAARNLALLLGPADLERLRAVETIAIGPVAADAARALGFRATTVAAEHTIPGLIATLEEAVGHG